MLSKYHTLQLHEGVVGWEMAVISTTSQPK